MEDIIALILVALVIVTVAYIVYRIVKKNRQVEHARRERQAKAYEKLAEMRQETTRKLIAEDTARVALRNRANYGHSQFDPKNPDVLLPKKTSLTAVPQPVSTPAPVNNWSDDLLTTMVISNMLSSHKNASASVVSRTDDTPVIKETYSKPSTDFGFDDSDSRTSSSSSFSSSDSSSSRSDSSSSDSGPSSDW